MIERNHQTPIMHRYVRHGDTLYFGGIVGSDMSAGMAEQTAQACSSLEQLLLEAGSGKDRLLSVTIYITDMELKGQMNESWLAWLDAADLPARATIGVSDLTPGCLIEIVATAAA